MLKNSRSSAWWMGGFFVILQNMIKKQAIQLFEERKVRTVWDDEQEKWYFSIVDVCGVLTDSPNPRNYWKVLKHRLLKEGNQTVTNCTQLKLRAACDMYQVPVTSCADWTSVLKALAFRWLWPWRLTRRAAKR